MRIFIAIDLPTEIKRQIGECQKALALSESRLNLVNPEMAHITLKFIGEVMPEMAERVSSELDSISFSPFEMIVEGISGDNRHRPRVIWANVSDGGVCARLANEVEHRLLRLGIERERRPFTPHVTLARVKRFHPSLLKAVDEISQRMLGVARVDGIVLKQSMLRPEGAIYHDLHRIIWR
ncbi:MAG: RNA 2',3'-cyclic phosphodiesterase [Methanomicrobiales archaeon]|nr:RNA 2',3'-cyclic phosphodiesterase [Methanomicrobiales archaeon]